MKKYKIVIIILFIIFPYLLIISYLLIGNRFNNLISKKQNIISKEIPEDCNIQKKNLYKDTVLKFESIKDKSSFLLFKKNSLYLMYLISLQKDKDIKNWNKYTSYLYKYDDFKKKFNSLEKLQELSSKYFNFNKEDNLSIKDINYDLDIIFSSVDLKKGIDLCQKFFNNGAGTNSCIDYVIFLRANKFNSFCEKIVDSYKSKFCVDYLKSKDEK